MTTSSLLTLSETELTRLVNTAFKSYHSLLELSRSPLANAPLITPALVLDEMAPTPDERGRALRVVLHWAVNRLAPVPSAYPLGTARSFDDPTWMEPLWWRYNILRHRYLEPLRPDDFELLGVGGFTDALMNLTGIARQDSYFDERKRAMRDVSLLLRQLLIKEGKDKSQVRQLAMEVYSASLQDYPAAREVLGVAATFRGVFARTLLLEMAAAEGIASPEVALSYLIKQRLLIEGDQGVNLLMPAALQAYLYPRQANTLILSARDYRAAQFYRQQKQPIEAAWHFQQGNRPTDAAEILLDVGKALLDEVHLETLPEMWQRFMPDQLVTTLWHDVQVLFSDLFYKIGHREEARSACRKALKVAKTASQKARIHRRLGKLYEDHNQLHALSYYQRAIELLPPNDPELPAILKERGWIYIHRQEWAKAESDLMQALEKTPPTARDLRADICDALGSLHRQQKQYELGISYAQQALVLREEIGDLSRVAYSCNNLALTYARLGEFKPALTAYEEALITLHKLGNREEIATVQLNMGGACYLANHFEQAIGHDRESLKIFQEIGIPRGEAQAHYNLAEAFVASGQKEQACQHWRIGYTLSQEQPGLEDQIKWFEQLREESIKKKGIDLAKSSTHSPEKDKRSSADANLSPEERIALEIAQQGGQITTKRLGEEAKISTSSATRKLRGLVKQGFLKKKGRGRGTHYVLSE